MDIVTAVSDFKLFTGDFHPPRKFRTILILIWHCCLFKYCTLLVNLQSSNFSDIPSSISLFLSYLHSRCICGSRHLSLNCKLKSLFYRSFKSFPKLSPYWCFFNKPDWHWTFQRASKGQGKQTETKQTVTNKINKLYCMPSLRHIYNTPCSKKCQQFSQICYIPNEYGIGWKRLKERQKTNIVLHCLQFKKFCELQLPWDRNTPIKFSVSRVACFLRGTFHHYKYPGPFYFSM